MEKFNIHQCFKVAQMKLVRASMTFSNCDTQNEIRRKHLYLRMSYNIKTSIARLKYNFMLLPLSTAFFL